jgi:ankyrin repeat protein
MGCSESRTIEIIKENQRKTMEFDEGESDFSLYEAIKDEDLTELKKIFDSGIDVNYKLKSFFSRTSLHVACILGNAKVVEFLLKLGAASDIEDEYGITAGFLAEVKGHTKCVQIIKGSNQNFENLVNNSVESKRGSITSRRFSIR